MTTNVPIPGGGANRVPVVTRSHRSTRSRRWFFVSVTVLALAAVVLALLAWGQPFNLAPGMTSSFAKSILALVLTFILVLPAFAVFRYERQSAGGAWHEPSWRPSLIGWLALIVSLGLAVGWHGLRLAFYVARVWTGEL